MNCLYCQERLPLLKRMQGWRYCSEEHAQQDLEEFGRAALVALSVATSSQTEDTRVAPGMAQAG